MNVLIFGGSYHQVATTKKAADNVAHYGTEVAENLTNNLYADKILKYVSNEETNKTDVRGKKHVCRQVPPYIICQQRQTCININSWRWKQKGICSGPKTEIWNVPQKRY